LWVVEHRTIWNYRTESAREDFISAFHAKVSKHAKRLNFGLEHGVWGFRCRA
jgi:hypothetical protein